MPLANFAASSALSIGVELELQLVNRHDYDLCTAGPDLLRLLGRASHPGEVKPEITDSMIEVSTGVCRTHAQALQELRSLRDTVAAAAARLNVGVCGGGTHPFQHWSERRIAEGARFKHLSDLYGYLAKQFTIYGQHVHVGCPGPDYALALLHGLGRFIPHFIALAASSPFVQGTDTGFDSARLNSVFAFPLSGRAPFLLSWTEFEAYFAKMERTRVVESMKDFYWDVRPKPEYGTVEVRVIDTPLTVERAAALAGYIQVLARYLMVERPWRPEEDDYLVYSFNRFQACRFGMDGTFVDPKTGEHRSLRQDILNLLPVLEQHAIELEAEEACRAVAKIIDGGNDASWIRRTQEAERSLNEVVRQQCERWEGRI
jgi:carboxylate-amine ligase